MSGWLIWPSFCEVNVHALRLSRDTWAYKPPARYPHSGKGTRAHLCAYKQGAHSKRTGHRSKPSPAWIRVFYAVRPLSGRRKNWERKCGSLRHRLGENTGNQSANVVI